MAASGLPEQIGRYRIRSRIATSQKSVLFRAFDPVSGENVALQLFGRPYVTEQFLTALQRDASRLSRLNNEHLLKVYAAGVEKGHAYLVTDVPPSYTLGSIVADGPLAPAEADEVITQLADGLSVMHGAGLIHAQLSPGTIYINGSGVPVLGGFCPLDPTESPFAAPEQRQGQPLSERSDVYSLGVLLLYLLTGSADLNIENISQLPVSYQDVVRKATSAATLARYRSVRDLAEALPLAHRIETPPQIAAADFPFEEDDVDVEADETEDPIPDPPPLPDFTATHSEVETADLDDANEVKHRSYLLPVLLGIVVLCLVLSAGGWWYGTSYLANLEPTAPAPTMLATAVANATSTPTATPTATPIPVHVAINSPTAGTSIDLGQSVALEIELSDPVGLRTVNILANGLLVTSFNAGGATTYSIDEAWTPNWRGGKVLEVVAINRNGEQLPVVETTIRVVDQALITEHQGTWTRIEQNVSQIRGLQPLEPVYPDLLSRSELQRRILEDDYFYDEESARMDVLVLHAFDFVPLSFDLYTESRRYLGNSIAGFYNYVTKEFVIVSDNDEMDVFNEWTYAHEFMHALQDQHYDLSQINAAPIGFEQQLAFSSLAEGEAELLQVLYLELGYFTQAQLVEIYSDYYFDVYKIKAQAPTHLPQVLINAFWFPYTTGYQFVASLYQQQGWAGVNAAWENVPQTSEQILHPERYLDGDLPSAVILPDLHSLLGKGYERTHHDTFGEFYLREYLGQQLTPAEVDLAATGWGGDQFAVYWNEDSQQVAMMLTTVWDSAIDAEEFRLAYESYATAAYGSIGTILDNGDHCWETTFAVCLIALDGEISVVRGMDLAQAQAIADTLR